MFQATKYVPRIAYGRNRRFMSFEFGWFKQYWRLNSRNKFTKSLTKHMYSLLIFLIYYKCVEHVIWTGCRILKLALTFEMFIHFFVFLLQITLQYFLLKSPNFFYILKVPQNTFHSNIKKNKTTKDMWNQFQHSTPCPNDMIHT